MSLLVLHFHLFIQVLDLIMLTQSRLKKLLHYNPQTGVFSWRGFRRRRGTKTSAGYLNSHGHVMIMIEGKNYPASRLAYFYKKGHWPPNQMDHKNRKPADNRWCNLRPATPSQNTCNRRGKRAQFKGITRVKSRYRAQIQVNRKYTHLGYFDTEAKAHATYVAAASKQHGEFAFFD
jgi:hypothetical protein